MKANHHRSSPTSIPIIHNPQMISGLVNPYTVSEPITNSEKVQEEDNASLSSSISSFDEEIVGDDVVYALHVFLATVEGQISVMRGDKLILLDDTNSYWWLVRQFDASESGYVPAENIETPFERLARFNKIRNTEVNLIPSSETSPHRVNQKRVSMSDKVLIQSMIIHIDSHSTHVAETYEESYGTIDNPTKELTRISNHALSVGLTQHYIKQRSFRHLLSIKSKPFATKEQTRVLRIFAGNLGGPVMFNSVLINHTTTTADLLLLALERFRLPTKKDGVEYYLTVKVLEGDEIALSPQENPLTLMDSLAANHPRSSRSRFGVSNSTSLDDKSGIRFLLNKRIKRVNKEEGLLRIKIAYYTPKAQPKSFRFSRWYYRSNPTPSDRIEKLVAVPDGMMVSDLTCLALTKFHLPHGVPYTCLDNKADKYGMTLVLHDKEHVLNGQRRIIDVLKDTWLNPKGKENQVLFVLRKMQSRVGLEDESVPCASFSATSSASSSLSDAPLVFVPVDEPAQRVSIIRLQNFI